MKWSLTASIHMEDLETSQDSSCTVLEECKKCDINERKIHDLLEELKVSQERASKLQEEKLSLETVTHILTKEIRDLQTKEPAQATLDNSNKIINNSDQEFREVKGRRAKMRKAYEQDFTPTSNFFDILHQQNKDQ